MFTSSELKESLLVREEGTDRDKEINTTCKTQKQLKFTGIERPLPKVTEAIHYIHYGWGQEVICLKLLKDLQGYSFHEFASLLG
jgi:hypothetical protein